MNAALRRLRIRYKLLLCSLAYGLPIAVLLYFVVSGFDEKLKFTRMEIWGNRVLRPLEQLLELVPQHRRLSFLYVSGDASVRNDLNAKAVQIEETFQRLILVVEGGKAQLAVAGESLQRAKMEDLQTAEIKNRWDRLRKGLDGYIPEMCDMEHVALLKDIRDLVRRVGDRSNLILDPVLGSYYTMDIVVAVIPQILDRLGEIMILGEQTLPGTTLSEQQMAKFGLLGSMLDKADLQRLVQDATSALGENEASTDGSPTFQSNITPALEELRDGFAHFLQILATLSMSREVGTTVEEFRKVGDRACEAAFRIRRVASDELEILLLRRVDRVERKRLTTLLLSMIVLAGAALLVFFISVGITRPLKEVMGVADKVAVGNIDDARRSLDRLLGDEDSQRGPDAVYTDAGDEIHHLAVGLGNMIDSLRSLILQVRKSGIQVATSSNEISASSRQLEATATQQAASTSEVSTTSQEISANSRELVTVVGDVVSVTTDTAMLAEDGRRRLQEMETTMEGLMEATASIASQLQAINEKTGDIGTIVTTITKVADQTNLLSLNASIEAEKAGKYGLGFSVVAREISRLADQTAVATLNIERMVQQMQSAVTSGVGEVGRFVEQVRGTVKEVVGMGGRLSAIIEHIEDATPRFEAVMRAMQDQSLGAEEICSAMAQLSEGAEQTRQVASEFSKVTQQLTSAVQEMQNEVSRFQIQQ